MLLPLVPVASKPLLRPAVYIRPPEVRKNPGMSADPFFGPADVFGDPCDGDVFRFVEEFV